MAPRANWKGFLRLSLVTCPVALFPATSESEKVSFNQINKNTGHRIKYAKVDAEEVSNEDIVKGYKVDTDAYVTVDHDELDNIALSTTYFFTEISLAAMIVSVARVATKANHKNLVLSN